MMNIVIKAKDYSISQPAFPPLDSLVSILNNTDSLRLDAEISEYKDTYRWSWWYLTPSVGYNLISAQPLIVINSGHIVSYFMNKRVVERKSISIRRRNVLLHKNNTIKLITLYNELKNKNIQLEMIRETFIRYHQLFEIKENQYKANEINTEVFLKEQISFDERKKAIVSQIDNINNNMIEIELLINTTVFIPLSYESFLIN